MTHATFLLTVLVVFFFIALVLGMRAWSVSAAKDEELASAPKDPVKKTPVKKTPVKKTPVKKDPVKKDPVKKDPVKKDPVKKDPVKKDPVKKDPVKKDVIVPDSAPLQDIKFVDRKLAEFFQRHAKAQVLQDIDPVLLVESGNYMSLTGWVLHDKLLLSNFAHNPHFHTLLIACSCALYDIGDGLIVLDKCLESDIPVSYAAWNVSDQASKWSAEVPWTEFLVAGLKAGSDEALDVFRSRGFTKWGSRFSVDRDWFLQKLHECGPDEKIFQELDRRGEASLASELLMEAIVRESIENEEAVRGGNEYAHGLEHIFLLPILTRYLEVRGFLELRQDGRMYENLLFYLQHFVEKEQARRLLDAFCCDDQSEVFTKISHLSQDNAEAVKWYRKAAEQEHSKAQFLLSSVATPAKPLIRGSRSSQTELSRALQNSKTPGQIRWMAIDFETANKDRASACAVGVVVGKGGRTEESCRYLIRPDSSYFEFTDIHGLSWKDVSNEPTFGELWPEIAELLKGVDIVAAHNMAFDRDVFYKCCTFYGITPPDIFWLCTWRDVSAKLWPDLPNNKLPTICNHLSIPLDHHEALSDALACAEILKRGIAKGVIQSKFFNSS